MFLNIYLNRDRLLLDLQQMHPKGDGMDAFLVEEEQQVVFARLGELDAIEGVDHGDAHEALGITLGADVTADALGELLLGGGGKPHLQLEGFAGKFLELQDSEQLLVLGGELEHVDIGEHADDAGFARHVLIGVITQVHPIDLCHANLPQFHS